MLGIVELIRRSIEGSLVAILLIAVAAILGGSEVISALLSDLSVSSFFFLLMLAIVLADLIAKFIGIVSSTFPDLIPKVDDDVLKRASMIKRLQPGQTVALLSGAHSARVILFLVIFSLLGLSYAAVPPQVQELLFGELSPADAAESFLREGVAGSIGYFLFFLGPTNLTPIVDAIAPDALAAKTMDGDIFLVGVRLYGLAFVLAVLRTLVIPITYLRARLRARQMPTPAVAPA